MAQKLAGKNFLLKTPLSETVATGSARPTKSQFTTIGGFQANTFDTSATIIDITTKISEFRKILNSRGIVTLTVGGEGFLEETDIHKNLELNLLNQKLRWFSLERDDGRVFISRFKLATFSTQGSHDGAVGLSIALESSSGVRIEDEDGDIYDSGEDRFVAFSSSVFNFDVINTFTGDYDGSTKQATFVSTYLDGVTLLNSSKVSRQEGSPFDVQGSTTMDEEGFPIILVEKSVLGQMDRVLQVRDEDLNQSINDKVHYVKTVTDSTGVEWEAFYISELRGMGEDLSISLRIGEA